MRTEVDPGDALETTAIEGTVHYGIAFQVIEENRHTGSRRLNLIEASGAWISPKDS